MRGALVLASGIAAVALALPAALGARTLAGCTATSVPTDQVTSHAATILGSSSGDAGARSFRWGTTKDYGSTVAVDTGSGRFSAALTGLEPETTYHYAAVCDGSVGEDMLVVTPAVPAPPPGTEGAPDLTWTVGQSTAMVGDTVTFTARAFNPGSPVGFSFRDIVPEGLEGVTATSTRGSCSIGKFGRQVVSCGAELRRGQSVIVTVVVRSTKTGTYENGASLTLENFPAFTPGQSSRVTTVASKRATAPLEVIDAPAPRTTPAAAATPALRPVPRTVSLRVAGRQLVGAVAAPSGPACATGVTVVLKRVDGAAVRRVASLQARSRQFAFPLPAGAGSYRVDVSATTRTGKACGAASSALVAVA